jgi:hypothetical protein
MISLRKAVIDDLDFLARIDLKADGLTSPTEVIMTSEDAVDHSNKIMKYIIDYDKGNGPLRWFPFHLLQYTGQLCFVNVQKQFQSSLIIISG